jgi:hypothetical protein
MGGSGTNPRIGIALRVIRPEPRANSLVRDADADAADRDDGAARTHGLERLR